MKKLLFTIVLFVLLTSTVFANVNIYKDHVLFSSGLSDLTLSTEYDEQGSQYVSITGNNLSEFKTDKDSNSYKYQNKIILTPGKPKMNSYNFWTIGGTYLDENFFIFGYSIEVGGNTWLERNSLSRDVIIILLVIGAVITLLLVQKKRKQKTSHNRHI